MKKFKLAFVLLMISSPVMALNTTSAVECNGADTTGQHIYFAASSGSSIVNINGSFLRVVGKTRDGKGVVTENFITVNGTLVYDSIVPISSNSLNIYQNNAVTERLLAQANLICRFIGNNSSKPQLTEQSIFSQIR